MKKEEYKVHNIPDYKYESLEQLGTKKKFWYTDDENDKKILFKIGRENTGENWVEVVVSEICEMLNIPQANYEFATWKTSNGTITTNFVPKDGRLILGNELLAKIYKIGRNNDSYPIDGYKIRKYQLNLIKKILTSVRINLPIGYSNKILNNAFNLFVGYIMLDCLISNPDRHHENWGLIIYKKTIYLAPTYDHASGLGCRESDENKLKRLTTKDKGFQVSSFVKKAKTPFHHNDKNVTTLEAFKICAKNNEKIAHYWLDQLEKLDMNKIRKVFEKVPQDFISQVSIDFAIKILEENKKRLLDFKKELIQ